LFLTNISLRDQLSETINLTSSDQYYVSITCGDQSLRDQLRCNQSCGVISTAVTIGCFAGWAYYYFVGCSSGGCMISGTWYISVPYGGLLGYLFLGSFLKSKNPQSLRDKS
jgi:hypothetical protein